MTDSYLYRLVYTSCSTIDGSPSEIKTTIDDLLTVARRKNSQVGITGALMFTENRFAQVLEGSEQAISSLYRKLESDPRHRSVRLLALEPIAVRNFGSWSMAYVGGHPDLAREFAELDADDDRNEGEIGGELVVELIARHLSNSAATA